MLNALPPLTWLRTFEAAARLGGFAAAAAELNVTPSAVSQHVRLLEQRLDAKLFAPAGRGVALTPIGRAYLPTVSGALSRIEERTHELFTKDRRRILRLRIDTTFAMLWLSRRLPSFIEYAPGVDLHVRALTWTGPDDLGEDDCVLWFGSTRRLPPGAVALTQETFIPVASPSVAAEINSPHDVHGRALIHVLADPVGWPDWFREAGLEPGLSESGARFDASGAVLEAAAHSGGLALAKQTFARSYLRAGRLERLPGPVLSPNEGFCFHAPERSGAEATVFLDWLHHELAQA